MSMLLKDNMENNQPKPESNNSIPSQEREPTNEERWVHDVNEEFQEDVPLVNEDLEEEVDEEDDAEDDNSNFTS